MADNGPDPYVTDIETATQGNNAFRVVLWTGAHLQLALMCLQPEEEIGLEVHHDRDQFLRIEEGAGRVVMGETRDEEPSFRREVGDGDVVLIPAGWWHNVINTGDEQLRLYSVYGPAEHEPGTVHLTKAEADAAEHDH